MKIAAFEHAGEYQVGLVSQDGSHVRPFMLSSDKRPVGLLCLIAWLESGGELPAVGDALPLAQVGLLAPFRSFRRNLWCVGRNYRAHAKELAGSVFQKEQEDGWPMVFTKVPEAVVGPHAEVRLPTEVSEQIDYEAELAVVIGRGGCNIARADAMKHVFGYTIVNDVTARDVQMRHGQWDLGKNLDGFCPMGPWVVTADEMDGCNTRVRCWVNGELRQDGHTADMIFDIPALIETMSRGITLYPGDVIATGTPAGVGMGMQPPRWLRTGDVVRVEVDGIGAIENRFI
ncbi:fumarylacetoacetate hydrolase family protein [Ramlibacter sp. WS9]|uniref:fumarylacetoacetate hydrolase family protein n=1 Tax=Ramlibacter sp. WS9 TaxID=1882741 RepID=UPI001142396A|nr:fumarylacetoacetate hydrolase family protein [Ramlibacter sp. WS9]ROZ79469.1 FAA hydrolase family protein [Ramlibacter sp. WS9]